MLGWTLSVVGEIAYLLRGLAVGKLGGGEINGVCLERDTQLERSWGAVAERARDEVKNMFCYVMLCVA